MNADKNFIYLRVLVVSAVGKSAGTFCVTLLVAARSVPRWKVVMDPTQLNAARSWPGSFYRRLSAFVGG